MTRWSRVSAVARLVNLHISRRGKWWDAPAQLFRRSRWACWSELTGCAACKCCSDGAEAKSVMADCWRRGSSSSWRFSYLPWNDKQLKKALKPGSAVCFICNHVHDCAQLADAVKLNMQTCKAQYAIESVCALSFTVEFFWSLSGQPQFNTNFVVFCFLNLIYWAFILKGSFNNEHPGVSPMDL